MELDEFGPLPVCLGWKGAEHDGNLVDTLTLLRDNELTGEWAVAQMHLRVPVFHGNWVVYVCSDPSNTDTSRIPDLRVAKDGDYFSAFVVKDAFDAFIAQDGKYLVTQHGQGRNGPFWLECRLLNDPEQVLWRTDACSWMNWFMGTGDTVWCGEWTGPYVKGKDWLVGRDLVTGVEIFRKVAPCRKIGLFCGPLIITASARSITAWEPIP